MVISNSFGSVTSSVATLTVTNGGLFLYEPFDYPNIGGPVSSNTPANWAYGGAVPNDLNVSAGNLWYPGLAQPVGNSVTNGGAGLGVRRLLGAAVNSGVLYFSALFRINDLGFGTWNGASSQVGASDGDRLDQLPLASDGEVELAVGLRHRRSKRRDRRDRDV